MFGTNLHRVAAFPVVIFLLWEVAESEGYHTLQSECPDVLKYVQSARGLEGHITVDRPRYPTDYELKIRYCVPLSAVEIPSKKRLSVDADDKRYLKYKILFPYRDTPSIQLITLNDEIWCHVPEDHNVDKRCIRISNVMHDAPRRNCGKASRFRAHAARGVERGEWPWAVSIFRQPDSSRLEFICGGSLIDERHIVTSAHCFRDKDKSYTNYEELFVKVGAHDLVRYFEPHTEIVGIRAVKIHPDYKPGNLIDDIAIVTLYRNVTYTPYIQPICHWSTTDVRPDKGTVISWGQKEGNSTANAQKRIVSVRSCEDANMAYVQLKYNRTFCAGSPAEPGVCEGDGGSGLYVEEDETWVLRGLVSSPRDGVCTLGEDILYTDVSKYKKWIQENIYHDNISGTDINYDANIHF